MRLLVTAGPTREFADPFRFISNPSSGRMGFALARAGRRRGHRVVLISGPVELRRPDGVKLVPVVSAREMRKKVLEYFFASDALIMAAAVADWRPAGRSSKKLKKNRRDSTLRLAPNPDILRDAGRKKGGRILVGFAAETGNLIDNARSKMISKRLDMVLANDISLPDSGFRSDRALLVAVGADGTVEEWPPMTKSRAAERIIARVERLAREKRTHDPD